MKVPLILETYDGQNIQVFWNHMFSHIITVYFQLYETQTPSNSSHGCFSQIYCKAIKIVNDLLKIACRFFKKLWIQHSNHCQTWCQFKQGLFHQRPICTKILKCLPKNSLGNTIDLFDKLNFILSYLYCLSSNIFLVISTNTTFSFDWVRLIHKNFPLCQGHFTCISGLSLIWSKNRRYRRNRSKAQNVKRTARPKAKKRQTQTWNRQENNI